MSLRERMGFTAEPLYIMDGNAFIFRGFFANQRMARSDAFPTGSIHIVGKTVFKILREERPEYFLFVLDGQGKHFRHEAFSEYKANRPPAPEELKQQFEPTKTMLKRLGIRVEVSENAEADDYIASLAKKYSAERPVVIIGMDKDLKQCLNPQVVMWDPASSKSKEDKIITMQSFMDETGLNPGQWPDVQALIGDSSDNIPGIKGIGEKTAIKLFQDFPNLEYIKEHFESLPPSIKKKMEGNLDIMFLYRKLTTLNTECCQLDLGKMQIQPVIEREALGFFKEYELNSLAKDFGELTRKNIIHLQKDSHLAEDTDREELKGNDGKAHGNANSLQGSLLNFANQAQKNTPEKILLNKDDLPCAKNCCLALIPDRQRLDKDTVKTTGFYLALCPLPQALTENSADKSADREQKPQKEQKQEQGNLFALFADTEEKITEEKKEEKKQENTGPAQADWHYAGEIKDLLPLLADAKYLVSCDVKALFHEYPFLQEHDKKFFDLSLSAWLLSADEKNYTWLSLANRHVTEYGIAQGLFMEHPAHVALSLFHNHIRQLQGRNLLHLMLTMELPLVSVLFSMEKEGIQVDMEALSGFLDEVEGELEKLTAQIYDIAGTTFNIRSSKQLSDILFSKLALPMAKSTKGGQSSTSQDVLEKLAGTHPIITTLQEFRKLEKIRSTYLEPLPKLADPCKRIHTTFNQTGTGTGRLSSSNPNLQNIPVRGELGQRMRQCFVAREGHMLVSADYSQVELRVLAHFSGDETLLNAFRNNEDIHVRTAALLHDMDMADVTADMRRHAKTINFGLLYGMGQRKLSQDLAISMQEAKRFMEVYFERFQTIKQFYEQVEDFARKHAYVVTLAGRQRSLPDIVSHNHQARAMAERQAVNTLIQGSAADIIKLAMLEVAHDEEIKAYNARLLLQIHDELIVEVPQEFAQNAGRRIAAIMQNVAQHKELQNKNNALVSKNTEEYGLSVPLLVDYGTGKNWGDAH